MKKQQVDYNSDEKILTIDLNIMAFFLMKDIEGKPKHPYALSAYQIAKEFCDFGNRDKYVKRIKVHLEQGTLYRYNDIIKSPLTNMSEEYSSYVLKLIKNAPHELKRFSNSLRPVGKHTVKKKTLSQDIEKIKNKSLKF